MSILVGNLANTLWLVSELEAEINLAFLFFFFKSRFVWNEQRERIFETDVSKQLLAALSGFK